MLSNAIQKLIFPQHPANMNWNSEYGTSQLIIIIDFCIGTEPQERMVEWNCTNIREWQGPSLNLGGWSTTKVRNLSVLESSVYHFMINRLYSDVIYWYHVISCCLSCVQILTIAQIRH